MRRRYHERVRRQPTLSTTEMQSVQKSQFSRPNCGGCCTPGRSEPPQLGSSEVIDALENVAQRASGKVNSKVLALRKFGGLSW